MDSWSVSQKAHGKLPKKVLLSYLFDYLIIVALIAGFYALDAVEPYHQHFSLRNYTLQYPYAVKERVPVPWLVVIAVACPIGIIAFYTFVIDGLFSHSRVEGPVGRRRWRTDRYTMKERLWEFNCGVLGLMLSVGAAFTITGALKNAIGKPRPDLIDRCKPSVFEDPQPFGLSNHSICTQTDNAILKDGFRSFPSGHSSTAFAGLFYLSIYLAAKMHVLDSRGEVWKTFIILVPTLGAALIAGSRIMDARHHPFDVLSGSLMGILVAWAAYRQYFPPVSETWRKGRAYSIRSWGREPLPPDAAGVGVEPLRAEKRSVDEEQGLASGYAGHDRDSSEDGAGNVFRQQISASQRSRQRNALARAGTASSTYSGPGTLRSVSPVPPLPGQMHTIAESPLTPNAPNPYSQDLPSTNPFANPPARGRDGDYGSPDDTDDEAYELQPQYPVHTPQQAYAPVGRSHSPAARGTDEDTEYRSPVPISVTPRKPLPENAAGGLQQ